MRLRSKLTCLKGAITKKAPMYVQFSIEKGCNLSCSMCSVVESRKHEKRLTLDDIKNIADQLVKMNVSLIVLGGGEPFLCQDLYEIIKILRLRNFDVRLQSNGVLINPKLVRDMAAEGVFGYTISLDTLNVKKQDLINRKVGSWADAIRGISILSENLPRKGSQLAINTVVSKMNLVDIPSLIEFVTRIGFYHGLIPVHTVGAKDHILRTNNSDYRCSDVEFQEIDRIYDKIIQMKREGYHVYNTYKFLNESREFLKTNKVKWSCKSPDLYFSISPSGNYVPCGDYSSEFNMLDPMFPDQYKNGIVQDSIRKKAKACDGCMYPCYAEINYFVSDPKVFIERFFQSLKMDQFIRSAYSYEEMLKLAEYYHKDVGRKENISSN